MKSKLENVKALFEKEIQEPFYYDLTINDISNVKGLFNKISEIYKIGLVTLYGSNNKVEIKDITYKQLETLNKYMLSFGIEVTHKIITSYDKDQYMKYLLDELTKLEEVNANVKIDWKTQHIVNTEITIKTKNKKETFVKIQNIMKNHLMACQLTNFLGLNLHSELNHYTMVYNLNKESHIIFFNFANMGKYGKSVSYITRHKFMT